MYRCRLLPTTQTTIHFTSFALPGRTKQSGHHFSMASIDFSAGFLLPRRSRFLFNGRKLTAPLRAESKDSASSSQPKKLRLFIQSAEVEDWKKWLPTGVFHGVSTSPLLLQKANVACHPKRLANLAAEATKLGAKEVQMQAWGKTVDNYLSVGMDLAQISSSLVVKVPTTTKGVEAAEKLAKQGVRINLVGVYSISQVLLALATGVEYASTNCSRLLESGKSKEDIKKMQVTIKNLGGTLKLLVEDLKSLGEMEDLTNCSILSLALPVPLIEQLFCDANTEREVAEQELAAFKNPYRLFF